MKYLVLAAITLFTPLTVASECSQWTKDAYQFALQQRAGDLKPAQITFDVKPQAN